MPRRASPTTSCWRIRWRWRWCAGGCAPGRGRGLTGDGSLRAKALARFGYTLTRSQAQALAEIDADLASDRRMLRLLQGDVGSGKTVVALLAMLRAVEAGKQAAHHGADRGAGEAAPPHAVAPVARRRSRC